jgi:hypothetical protein
VTDYDYLDVQEIVEALTLQQFTDRSNNLSRSLGSLELILFSNPLNLRVTDEAPPLYYNIQSWYIVYLAFKNYLNTKSTPRFLFKSDIDIPFIKLCEYHPSTLEKLIKYY